MKVTDGIKPYPKNAKLIFSRDCPMISKIEELIINTFGV
jgi:hypothetical protein